MAHGAINLSCVYVCSRLTLSSVSNSSWFPLAFSLPFNLRHTQVYARLRMHTHTDKHPPPLSLPYKSDKNAIYSEIHLAITRRWRQQAPFPPKVLVNHPWQRQAAKPRDSHINKSLIKKAEVPLFNMTVMNQHFVSPWSAASVSDIRNGYIFRGKTVHVLSLFSSFVLILLFPLRPTNTYTQVPRGTAHPAVLKRVHFILSQGTDSHRLKWAGDWTESKF